MKGRYVFFAIVTGCMLAGLAAPYHMETAYWAESPIAWVAYMLIGSVAAIIALYMFFRVQRSILMGGDKEDTRDE